MVRSKGQDGDKHFTQKWTQLYSFQIQWQSQLDYDKSTKTFQPKLIKVRLRWCIFFLEQYHSAHSSLYG